MNGDFGLGWYNYGKRRSPPAIGRFPSVDPIIDKFAYLTLYNYAENEPVASIDLHGLQKFIVTANQLSEFNNQDINKSDFNAYHLSFSIENQDGTSSKVVPSNDIIMFENKSMGEKKGNSLQEGVSYGLSWHGNSSFSVDEQIKIHAAGDNKGKTNIHPLNSSEMATDDPNKGYSIGCKGVCFEKDATLSKDSKNIYAAGEHHYTTTDNRVPKDKAEKKEFYKAWLNSRSAMNEIRQLYEDNKDKLQKQNNFELKIKPR